MTHRDATDPRLTVGPALMVTLSATLWLADRALDGAAQTVARVVLLAAVLATTAWCGSVLRGADRSNSSSRD